MRLTINSGRFDTNILNREKLTPKFKTVEEAAKEQLKSLENIQKEEDARKECIKKETELAADIIRANCAMPGFLVNQKQVIDKRNSVINNVLKNIDELKALGMKEYIMPFLEKRDNAVDIYPGFVVENSVLDIEAKELPTAAIGWMEDEVEPLRMFERYLKAKGIFYLYFADEFQDFFKDRFEGEQREKFLDTLKFQKNYAEAMLNPTSRIIKNEARRIDIVNTFETAESLNDDGDIQGGAYNLNSAIQKTKEFESKIDEALENKHLVPEDRLYFDYQKKIAQTMLQKFNERYETLYVSNDGGYGYDDIKKPDLYSILTEGLVDDITDGDKLSDIEKRNVEVLSKASDELKSIAKNIKAEPEELCEFCDDDKLTKTENRQEKPSCISDRTTGMFGRLKNLVRACASLF